MNIGVFSTGARVLSLKMRYSAVQFLSTQNHCAPVLRGQLPPKIQHFLQKTWSPTCRAVRPMMMTTTLHVRREFSLNMTRAKDSANLIKFKHSRRFMLRLPSSNRLPTFPAHTPPFDAGNRDLQGHGRTVANSVERSVALNLEENSPSRI